MALYHTSPKINRISAIWMMGILLLLVVTRTDAQSLLIDGDPKDWKSLAVESKQSFVDTNHQSPFQEMNLVHDANFLYLQFKLKDNIALTESNSENAQIYLYLDIDGNTKTGYQEGIGIGAELGINFPQKVAYWNKGEGDKFNLDPLNIRVQPTVTSSDFEIAIPRQLPVPGREPVEIGDTIGVQLKDDVSQTLFPSSSEGAHYAFQGKGLPDPKTRPIPKETDSTFRMVTYNVLDNGLLDSNRQPYFKKIFQTLKPEIITLNECWDIKAQEARAFFQETLPLSGNQKWYATKKDEGNITLARYPITASWSIHEDHRLTANLIDLPEKAILPHQVLVINGHLSCCDQVEKRKAQANAFLDFVQEAQREHLTGNVPIVLSGDLNLVGEQATLNLLKNGTGHFQPDWDFTGLVSAKGKQIDSRMTFTWENPESEWPAGKLDYMIYSDAFLKAARSLTLNSQNIPESMLAKWPITDSSTRLASDHLPLVTDFKLSPFTPMADQPLWLNPSISSDSLQIRSRIEGEKITIQNASGDEKRVLTGNPDKTFYWINTRKWDAGSYFIRWQGKEKVYVKKFLITG